MQQQIHACGECVPSSGLAVTLNTAITKANGRFSCKGKGELSHDFYLYIDAQSSISLFLADYDLTVLSTVRALSSPL
jgi:hypothetical protein